MVNERTRLNWYNLQKPHIPEIFKRPHAPKQKILIVGGGLAGLCLAQCLQRGNIPFRVFEEDTHETWAGKGYPITLNAHGLGSLDECLPANLKGMFALTHITKTETEGVPGFDALSGEPKENPMTRGLDQIDGSEAPHGCQVDQTVLKRLLSIGLRPQVELEFGKKFERYELKKGGVTVFFQDGSWESGTLLVGADGVHSRVRHQFAPRFRTLKDTGLRSIYGKTPITKELRDAFTFDDDADAFHMPFIAHQADNNMYLLAGPVRFDHDGFSGLDPELAASPKPYIYWTLLARRGVIPTSSDPDGKKNLNFTSQQAANLAVEITAGWHYSLRALFELQDPSQAAVVRMHTSTDRPLLGTSDARLCFIGDAAFCPRGANAALRQAWNLGETLVQSKEWTCGWETTGENKHNHWQASDSETQEENKGFRINMRDPLFGMPPFEEITAHELYHKE